MLYFIINKISRIYLGNYITLYYTLTITRNKTRFFFINTNVPICFIYQLS